MPRLKVCESCGALVPDELTLWTRHREFHRRVDKTDPEGFDIIDL